MLVELVEDSFFVYSSDDELDDLECQECEGKPPEEDEDEEAAHP